MALFLSWHQAGHGIQRILVPTDPTEQAWTIDHISDYSQDEQLSTTDVNGDGVVDVITGTSWLDSANGWEVNPIHQTGELPDRHVIADINSDCITDVVVGEHDLEDPGRARLLLYTNLDGEGRAWNKSAIAQGDEHHSGALVVDLDQDGDKDIVSIGWGHSSVLVYENLGKQAAPI